MSDAGFVLKFFDTAMLIGRCLIALLQSVQATMLFIHARISQSLFYISSASSSFLMSPFLNLSSHAPSSTSCTVLNLYGKLGFLMSRDSLRTFGVLSQSALTGGVGREGRSRHIENVYCDED